jgi:hypothetical protein
MEKNWGQSEWQNVVGGAVTWVIMIYLGMFALLATVAFLFLPFVWVWLIRITICGPDHPESTTPEEFKTAVRQFWVGLIIVTVVAVFIQHLIGPIMDEEFLGPMAGIRPWKFLHLY